MGTSATTVRAGGALGIALAALLASASHARAQSWRETLTGTTDATVPGTYDVSDTRSFAIQAAVAGDFWLTFPSLQVGGGQGCFVDRIVVRVNGTVMLDESYGSVDSLAPGWTRSSPNVAVRTFGDPYLWPDGVTERRVGSKMPAVVGDVFQVELLLEGRARVEYVDPSDPDAGVRRFGIFCTSFGNLSSRPPRFFAFEPSLPVVHWQFDGGGSIDYEYFPVLPNETTITWRSLTPELVTFDDPSQPGLTVRSGPGRARVEATFFPPASWPDQTGVPIVRLVEFNVQDISGIGGPAQVTAGSTVGFGISSTLDPITWLVDGVVAGTGPTFTWSVPLDAPPTVEIAAVVASPPPPSYYYAYYYPQARQISVLGSRPRTVPTRATDEDPTNVTEGTGDGASGSGECTVLHHNGENRITRTDLVVQGRGECHFVVSRRYRSRIEWEGELGHNWDSNLFEKLVVDPTTGDVQRVDMGRVDTWRRSGDAFVAPAGFFGTLVQRADGTYVLREPDGSRRAFRADGLLLRWEDRSGNRVLFERDEITKQLTRALDAYDRPITFSFEAGKLVAVTDFAGREVRYGYEGGHLVSARTPVVVGTPTGDDFPAGRTELYAYTSDRADPRLAHNLASITLPQEAATGGTSYYAWTYEEDPAKPFLFDRVATQRLGGTNASGVPAGGTYLFTYERLNAGLPAGDPTVQRTKTTVVDRVGNAVEHFANENGDELLRRVLTRGLRPDDPATFETRSLYDQDGTLLERTFPEGNSLRLTYASDPRAARRNVTEVRLVAGPRGGGADLVTRMTYEPLCQRLASITDPRGTAPYTAPLGSWSAERYTSRMVFDYQEGSGPVPDAVEFGIDLSSMDRGLGDLNGDGRIDQVQGHVVRTQAPSVTLRPESLEAERLGSTSQAVITDAVWNDHGQPTSVVDAEGIVTDLVYHPQSDPDGDGVADSTLPSDASGYLAAVLRDARTSPRRRTIAPPLRLETRLSYDRLGHVTGVQDPRGVVTRVDVNVLGEVLQVTRGDDVGVAVMTGQLVTGEAPLRYRARFFHDFNGRVVRTEVENRDDAAPGVGPLCPSPK